MPESPVVEGLPTCEFLVSVLGAWIDVLVPSITPAALQADL
jgi:hypothetical protein